MDGDGIEADERMRNVRIWHGCPPFDVKICMFEVEQWLAASYNDISIDLEHGGQRNVQDEVAEVERKIIQIVWAENEKFEGSTQNSEV